MKIGILGTGMVGQTIASRLFELRHEVMIGTRDVMEKMTSPGKEGPGNPSFGEWQSKCPDVGIGTFAEASAFGELIINATLGAASLSALSLAGGSNLSGKILVDVSNPLDFSRGMPPSLIPDLQNTNSLGEEIQKAYPSARVVKTLNTMWCGLMVHPCMLGGGEHVNYICGNDADAKNEVINLLKQFGWRQANIIDLGDITGARASESVLLVWIRLMGVLNTGVFNLRLMK